MRHRSIFLFVFSSVILVMSIQQLPFAQLPIYNSDFKLSRSIRSKGDFGDSLRLMGIVDRTYDIQGSKVIEYYEMNTATFLGFAGDTMQFNLRKLPYLCRTPMMRRLVKQFGPATAHDIRQGKFVPGILQKDILEMYSWPKKRKREGKKTLWTYETVVLEFEKGVLTQFTRQGS